MPSPSRCLLFLLLLFAVFLSASGFAQGREDEIVANLAGGRVIIHVAKDIILFAAIDQPLSLVQVWFALSIRTLLLAVPIQGLGGLGTMQVWWTAGLTLLGWPAQQAIAASLAVHLLDLCISLPQAALGWLVLTFRRPAPVDEQPAAVDAQRR